MGNPIEVVITGMGAICGAGVGVAALRAAADEGRSGVTTITEFDTTNLPVKIAGSARAFDPASVLDAKQVRLAARVVQLAVGAAVEATGTEVAGALGDVMRFGTMVGTSTGGIEVIADGMETLAVKGPRRVSPFAVPQLMDNAAAAWIALRWGFRGPAYSVSTACSTSMDAIGIASDMIRSGRLDACLAGGAEGAVIPYMMAEFARSNMLSKRNDDPATASRPFDKDRDGFVMGEGAGLLLLERRDRAEKRGAKILARVAGYGAAMDANPDMISPRPDGRSLTGAMEQALNQAGISTTDIGYISAHGMSAQTEDVSEAASIRTVFGAYADKIPVGATKSVTGYTLAASGALSTIAAILAVRDGWLFPNQTFKTPDPDCRLNILAGKPGHATVKYAMANALGFGGHGSCLILAAP